MSPVAITLSLLLFSIVMFVWEKIPLAATAMIVCITLVVTGVFDVKTAFAGFINQNVILFVAMFVVGGALFETGVTDKIGGIVTRYARSEGNDSNLLIVFYVQIMPDDLVMQLHRF
ncbi:hypothetical protein A3N50_15305 [Klebsiella aerogenes]|nr:hypothetical protein P848_00178 [Klebsiella aerogenes UCI 45]KZQ66671.1 hypothetical protein A3N50_15305 [Klebsiella aerogenes]